MYHIYFNFDLTLDTYKMLKFPIFIAPYFFFFYMVYLTLIDSLIKV